LLSFVLVINSLTHDLAAGSVGTLSFHHGDWLLRDVNLHLADSLLGPVLLSTGRFQPPSKQ
jgi:hypothetical protein